jgi:hypothetical protein
MEAETRKHIMQVAKYLHIFSCELLKRASEHDASKLEEPEASIFEKMTPLLKGCTYGSDEYKKMLAEMKPALDHHYANNKHHPEFNDINGFSFQTSNDPIKSMDLFDIVEMICDWLAASKRHNDGNIGNSITINKKRFHIEDQLEMLLRNTAARLGEIDNKIKDKING